MRHVVVAADRVTIQDVVDCWCFCARSWFLPPTWPKTEPLQRHFGQSEDNVGSIKRHVAVRAANADLYPPYLGRSVRPCRRICMKRFWSRPGLGVISQSADTVKDGICPRWSSRRNPRNMPRPKCSVARKPVRCGGTARAGHRRRRPLLHYCGRHGQGVGGDNNGRQRRGGGGGIVMILQWPMPWFILFSPPVKSVTPRIGLEPRPGGLPEPA
jgi:hypothetical protein